MLRKITSIAALGLGSVLGLGAGAASADHLNIDMTGAGVRGHTLVIPAVTMDKPGFVVLHAMTEDGPVVPSSIGHVHVPAGTSSMVKVPFDMMPAGGTRYMVMLHYDTNGDGTYSFGAGMTDVDTPATKADGSPYTVIFSTAM